MGVGTKRLVYQFICLHDCIYQGFSVIRLLNSTISLKTLLLAAQLIAQYTAKACRLKQVC